MSANYREPQFLLPNCKNLKLPGTGTSVGSGLTEDRHSLYSMDFDSGSSDYIQTNYNANLIGNSPQSFSMWFKSKSTGIQYKTLIGQYQENALCGWGIEIGQPSNLDKITWYSRSSSTIDRTSYGSALTQNQWYHLVLVINSASLNNVNYSIYLNGTALVENATSSNYNNTSVLNSFQINNRYANQAYYGGGDFVIDEVAIFSRVLLAFCSNILDSKLASSHREEDKVFANSGRSVTFFLIHSKFSSLLNEPS